MKLIVVFAIVVGVVMYAYDESKYMIGKDEQVIVVDRNGNPGKAVYSVPGIYYKLPFIHEDIHFGKLINALDIEQQILTKDYKVVLINSIAYWKIVDPVLFYKIQCKSS